MSMLYKPVLPGQSPNSNQPPPTHRKSGFIVEQKMEFGDGSTIKELLKRKDTLIAPLSEK